jgi:hypothetical protein
MTDRLGDLVTQWRRAPFVIAMKNGIMVKVDGMILGDGHIGVHIGVTHFVDVTHILSGLQLARFKTLGAAVEYAERIGHFRDWTLMPVAFSPEETTALIYLRDALIMSEHLPYRVTL